MFYLAATKLQDGITVYLESWDYWCTNIREAQQFETRNDAINKMVDYVRVNPWFGLESYRIVQYNEGSPQTIVFNQEQYLKALQDAHAKLNPLDKIVLGVNNVMVCDSQW